MDFLSALQNFHLLRPAWLLASFPLGLLIWLYARSQLHNRNWATIIDKRLLPHLLQGTKPASKSKQVKILILAASLIILALSGPAFEKRAQSVFKTQSGLVILLDLSRSMDATDIKPNRLSRARFKINDILKQRNEGQTALIAYAANAYIVSPLTDDTKTIISQLPALETGIMPNQGSRLDLALEKAEELLNNSGYSTGTVFILSDGINQNALNTIRQLRKKNITTSVLGIGTKQGAPIATERGGFLKNDRGEIVIPKLDTSAIKQAASLGGGKYSLITAGDQDINKLLSGIKTNKAAKEQIDANGNKFKTDIWHEEGPWLLLLVIPFAAYAFRKGLIFILLLFIIPLPQPAQAASWAELWNTKDQLGAAALEQGNAEKAAELFNNSEWKAAAYYKAQQYQKAAELLSDLDTPDANYNRGNALAKTGNIKDAINAYKRTLEQQPEHEDAKHNLDVLEKAQQNSEQDKSDNNNQDNENQQDSQNQQNSESSQQNNNQDQGNKSDNKQSAPNPSDEPSDQNSSTDPNMDQDNNNQQQDQMQQKKQSESEEAEDESDKNNKSETDMETDGKPKDEEKQSPSQQPTTEKTSPDLNSQKTQQWLKKIPDDPGGLLRRKFKYQYSREKHQTEQEQW